ncbi:MAG: alcohol dehydrogenase catalytic domain-containing protein [Chloroflexi bacterium]|nr:alcohol dehydrogenase catalytic domain-containing protein [Chloroflexota bacterium]
MTTMTAAVLQYHGDRDAVKLISVPLPQPKPGEVRIKVEACALNWLDVGIRRGPKFGAIPLPLITGSDIAGVIDAVGDQVEGWAAGDAVLVYPLITCSVCELCRSGSLTVCPDHKIIGEHINGGLAEYVTVPAANLIRKPDSLSFEAVAALPVVGMTAWHMLITLGQLRVGETVLIPGAGGGVASISVQIARHAGAHILATTSSPEKMQKAHDLGAEVVVDYRDPTWTAQILDATAQRGVDMVQNNVGASTWADSLAVLARNGRLVVCGSHAGTNFDLSIPQIYHRQLRIIGANGGTYPGLVTVLKLAESGVVQPVVDTVLPLSEIHEGHRLLEERDHFGKVVIRIA